MIEKANIFCVSQNKVSTTNVNIDNTCWQNIDKFFSHLKAGRHFAAAVVHFSQLAQIFVIQIYKISIFFSKLFLISCDVEIHKCISLIKSKLWAIVLISKPSKSCSSIWLFFVGLSWTRQSSCLAAPSLHHFRVRPLWHLVSQGHPGQTVC